MRMASAASPRARMVEGGSGNLQYGSPSKCLGEECGPQCWKLKWSLELGLLFDRSTVVLSTPINVALCHNGYGWLNSSSLVSKLRDSTKARSCTKDASRPMASRDTATSPDTTCRRKAPKTMTVVAAADGKTATKACQTIAMQRPNGNAQRELAQ
eukprot:660973-Amphidinium_carterae.1